MLEHHYDGVQAYCQSKLALVMFTFDLAEELAGTGVTANCLHPGAVATGLGHNNGRLARLLARALRPFFRTAVEGAATSVYLASAPAVERVSGRYFVDCREARSSPPSYDQGLARRLWEVSARMTGLAA